MDVDNEPTGGPQRVLVPSRIVDEMADTSSLWVSSATDVGRQLDRLQSDMSQLHETLRAHQHTTDSRLFELATRVRELTGNPQPPSRSNSPSRLPRNRRRVSKDSPANYLRVSKHLSLLYIPTRANVT